MMRDYLPYASAREFKDRGMAKWMGFFLSEHTSSLGELNTVIDLSSQLTNEEKLIYVGQLYANQQKVQLTVKERKQKVAYIATIYEISSENIILKSYDGFKAVSLENILQIEVLKDESYG